MKTEKKQSKLYQITNKQNNLTDFVRGILNRTLGMFEYTNLPDTLPAVEIEKRLQLHGHATIFKYKGSLYVTTGSYCGMEKRDRKSTRLNSSHVSISYAVFCLKQKK